MESGTQGQGLRSRSGCMTCRRRHRKCDERRPVCYRCQSRELDCDYQIHLRWSHTAGSGSKNLQDRKNSRNTKPGADSIGSCSAVTRSTASIPTLTASASTLALPQSSALPQASESTDVDHLCLASYPATAVQSLDSRHSALSSSQRLSVVSWSGSLEDQVQPTGVVEEDALHHGDHLSPGEESIQSPILYSSGAQENISADCRRSLHWHQVMLASDVYCPPDDGANSSRSEADHCGSITQAIDATPQGEDPSAADSLTRTDDELLHDETQETASPAGSTPWVIDNTLSNLLFQIFKSPGEEIAFTYFFKRVCTCIPAYDGVANPWRKLAFVALSYPVLLHGILSVATAHMYNYGRSNESLLSSRQGRAIKSLQAALNALQANKRRDETGKSLSTGLLDGNVFSILSANEIALAAIMMQTSSVLMTGAGNVEMHLKCALHFIRNLDYLYAPARSIFSRTLINRFAMVDVIHAHLRFQRPLAPLDFFLYQENDSLDHMDPPFREMHGCEQRVLCFLAEIAVLSADLLDGSKIHDLVQIEAYSLERKMRDWGHEYHSAMLRGASESSVSSHNPTFPSLNSVRSPSASNELSSLSIVCECFYWTAHLLLLRRLFLDNTSSPRVQLIRKHMFRLMDRLEDGCGPDSSLPFPFYMSAREATTPEDQAWVRRKHGTMMEIYRDRSRDSMMESTEKVWKNTSSTQTVPLGEGIPSWCIPREIYIREMDKAASYFMF